MNIWKNMKTAYTKLSNFINLKFETFEFEYISKFWNLKFEISTLHIPNFQIWYSEIWNCWNLKLLKIEFEISSYEVEIVQLWILEISKKFGLSKLSNFKFRYTQS